MMRLFVDTAGAAAGSYEVSKQPQTHRAFRGASRLVSIAGWAPEARLPSRELTAIVEGRVPFDLEERTGIVERRQADAGMTPADLAMKAIEKAIAKAGIDSSEIDLLIYCGVSREYVEPATATVLHQRLGLRGTPAFDITDACLGFMDAWCVADAMIAAGRARYALIACAEIGSPYARISAEQIRAGGDPKSLFSAMTLGDGAAAAVLGPKAPGLEAAGLVSGVRESYGEHHQLCVLPALGQAMHTHPTQLFEAALSRVPSMYGALLGDCGWSSADIDLVVPHQVTVRHIHKGVKLLGVPAERVGITVDRYGNMGSVSVPFTLAEAIEQGRVGAGSKVFLSGFGSGLGMAMMAVRL